MYTTKHSVAHFIRPNWVSVRQQTSFLSQLFRIEQNVQQSANNIALLIGIHRGAWFCPKYSHLLPGEFVSVWYISCCIIGVPAGCPLVMDFFISPCWPQQVPDVSGISQGETPNIHNSHSWPNLPPCHLCSWIQQSIHSTRKLSRPSGAPAVPGAFLASQFWFPAPRSWYPQLPVGNQACVSIYEPVVLICTSNSHQSRNPFVRFYCKLLEIAFIF